MGQVSSPFAGMVTGNITSPIRKTYAASGTYTGGSPVTIDKGNSNQKYIYWKSTATISFASADLLTSVIADNATRILESAAIDGTVDPGGTAWTTVVFDTIVSLGGAIIVTAYSTLFANSSQTHSSSDINLQINNPETEAVLEGEGNDTCNKVEGGKLVNKNT